MKQRLVKPLAALLLVCALLPWAAGAAYTDQSGIKYPQAVETLTELGVFRGKEDGSFDPAASVTRGEMCTVLCCLLNGGKQPKFGEVSHYSYTDVDAHWARYNIEYCTALGIAGGRGDGTFDPDGGVTGREAAKMLLVTAGYDAEKAGLAGDGWAAGVDELAEAQGLYAGLPDDCRDRALTRDETAQMVYHALSVERVAFWDRVVGPDGTWEPEVLELDAPRSLGVTLLEDLFKMELRDGVLTPIQ